MARVGAVAVLCVYSLSGCGALHRFARENALYQAEGRELQAIQSLSNAFAKALEGGHTDSLLDHLDPQGRKALVIFAATLAYEKSDKIKAYVELAQMAVLFVMAASVFAKSCPLDDLSLERGWEWILGKIQEAAAEELGADIPELRQPDGLSIVAERVRQSGGKPQMAARLKALEHTVHGCRFVDSPVSFRAWLLKHETWSHAERSRTFREWKQRIDKVHLAHVACSEQHALLVLSSCGDSLQLMEWRLFSSAEWPSVARRMAQLTLAVTVPPAATSR